LASSAVFDFGVGDGLCRPAPIAPELAPTVSSLTLLGCFLVSVATFLDLSTGNRIDLLVALAPDIVSSCGGCVDLAACDCALQGARRVAAPPDLEQLEASDPAADPEASWGGLCVVLSDELATGATAGEAETEMLWGHSQEGAFVGSSFVKTSSTSLIHVKAPPGSSLDIGFSLRRKLPSAARGRAM
jgi:hypothetical protein